MNMAKVLSNFEGIPQEMVTPRFRLEDYQQAFQERPRLHKNVIETEPWESVRYAERHGLDPELGYGRPDIYLNHLGVHAIAGQRLLDNLGAAYIVSLAELNINRLVQDVNGRQAPSVHSSQRQEAPVLPPVRNGDGFYWLLG